MWRSERAGVLPGFRLALSLTPLLLVSACNDGALFTPGGASSSSSSSSSSSGSSSSSSSSGSTSTGSGSSGSSSTPTTQSFQTAVTGLASGASIGYTLSYGQTVESTGTLSSNGTSLVSGPPVPAQDSYNFSVSTQPASQTCTISNGSGTISGNSVPPVVTFTCTTVSPPSGLRHPAAAPQVRKGAVSWTNADGTFGLFGGETTDASGAIHSLGDLWQFSVRQQRWSEVAPSGEAPAARGFASSWVDAMGNVWVFGGRTVFGSNLHLLNDLWRYDTNLQSWSCESGCQGPKAADSPAAVPSSRESASTWVDSAGNLWLFSGTGASAATSAGDVWRYGPSTHLWTLMSGPTEDPQP